MPGIGDVIAGKYRIESKIGKGGMGCVYSARHEITNRLFALKILDPSQTRNYESRERFIREAKLAGAIEHSGVVEIYDVGHHGNSLYMVMDLLKGETLGERLRRGALPMKEAIRIMLAVLSAVGAAHKRGILHRDLKPDNIFLCHSPETGHVVPKILDFGVSKALSPDGAPTTNLTATGIILGTPMYMSPEQVRGAKDIDLRTDIYALGAILYEMFTGSVPFKAKTLDALIFKILSENPDPLSSRMEGVTDALNDVVMRAMAPEREDRFQDIESFARALTPFLEGVQPLLTSDKSVPTQKGITFGPYGKRRAAGAPDTLPEVYGLKPPEPLPAQESFVQPNLAPSLPQQAGPVESAPSLSISMGYSLPVRKIPIGIILGVGGIVVGVIIIFLLIRGSKDANSDASLREPQSSAVTQSDSAEALKQNEPVREEKIEPRIQQPASQELPTGKAPPELEDLEQESASHVSSQQPIFKRRSTPKKRKRSGTKTKSKKRTKGAIFEVEKDDILNPF